MKLTASYIDALAPNPGAITNGKSLLKKGSFANMGIADNNLIFGECQGSGKKAYQCSMDFADEAKPVPRCTCPSRQYPCKHVMGLMYAYAQGTPFAQASVPEDIAAKRANAEKRAENKAEKTEKVKNTDINAAPSKAKITAATKKINIQLEGIEIAEKLLKNIIQTGLAGHDAKARKALGEQITQLGNYRIRGIQRAFADLQLYMMEQAEFTVSIPHIIYLSALLKKAREHLSAKLQDPPNILKLDITSAIEEQVDHTWKLEELHAYGSYISSAEIIQLSFDVLDDPAKKEFVDTGYFIDIQTGHIYTTQNFRPYKALKYINQDDSILTPIVAETLYIYPGGLNPRARYDKFTYRAWQTSDYAAIKQHAHDDYPALIKIIKNQIRTPLANKNPVALVKIHDIQAVQDPEGQTYATINDSAGNTQLLKGDTLPAMLMIDPTLLQGHALLIMYESHIPSGMLTAIPLSIITDDRIIRLKY